MAAVFFDRPDPKQPDKEVLFVAIQADQFNRVERQATEKDRADYAGAFAEYERTREDPKGEKKARADALKGMSADDLAKEMQRRNFEAAVTSQGGTLDGRTAESAMEGGSSVDVEHLHPSVRSDDQAPGSGARRGEMEAREMITTKPGEDFQTPRSTTLLPGGEVDEQGDKETKDRLAAEKQAIADASKPPAALRPDEARSDAPSNSTTGGKRAPDAPTQGAPRGHKK